MLANSQFVLQFSPVKDKVALYILTFWEFHLASKESSREAVKLNLFALAEGKENYFVVLIDTTNTNKPLCTANRAFNFDIQDKHDVKCMKRNTETKIYS